MPAPKLFRPHLPLLLSLFLFTFPLLMMLMMLLTGCTSGTDALEQASRSYKAHRDYASLEIIHRHLHKGMTRSTVAELLGKADYSPIAGQEYYSSDRSERAGSGKEQLIQLDMPVGLVVDYRNEQHELTGQLQTFWLGAIGE